MGDDLHSFIEAQKLKLEQERNMLTLGYPGETKTADYRSQSQASSGDKPRSKFTAIPTESDLEETGLKLGGYEEKQKKLKQERAQEYRKFLAEKNMRSTGKVDPVLSHDVSPPLPGRSTNKKSPRDQINNDRADERDRGSTPVSSRRRGKENRDDHGRYDDGDYYDRAPRRRPESYYDPYEELLRQKRADERRYRQRYDDYEDDRPMKLSAPQYKYSSRSDGILNRRYEDDYDDYSPRRRDGRGYRDRYDSKRVRFLESGDYDDSRRPPRVPRIDSYNDDDEDLREKARSRSRRRNSAHERYNDDDDILGSSLDKDNKPRSQSAPLSEVGGILGMGGSSSDKSKKQNQYRQELEEQIREREEKKKKEKLIKLGRLDDIDSPNKPNTFNIGGNRQPAPQQQVPRNAPPLDPYSARTQAFEQPTSFLGPYNDDLYSGLLGGLSADPLSGYDRGMAGRGDETGYSPSFGATNQQAPVHSSRTPRPGRDATYAQTGPSQGVGGRPMNPPGGVSSGGQTDDEVQQNKIAKQRQYQEQLKVQMQEKEAVKQKSKHDQEKYDRKMDEEIKNYNPWGRGGAGAPIKDSKGLAVTDLRTMHQFNQEGKIVSPRDPPPPVDTRFQLDLQEDYTDSSHQGDSAANSSPYARANTFREDQPQDMAKQQAQEEYKLFLKQQVEEKQKKKKEEDDMIREEELREEKRLEEQRLRMQREFEQEKEKQRLKEEETLKRNEEMKAASELKKKEAERRRKEMDEERQNELRKLAAQRNTNIDAQHVRTSSPVIPTLRAKEEPRSDSPPLPGQRKNQGEQPPVSLQEDIPQAAPQRYRSPPLQPNRPESLVSVRTEPDQDVLSQLTALKQQLKNEEMKIQSQMQNNKLASTRNRDPTSASRRAPRRDVDVFDRAVHNKVPARKSDGENYSPAEEFNKIKYGDATSLAGDFRNQYPEPASSGSVLDLQQQAYLREQEDRLASLRADLNEGRPGPSGTRQNGHYPPRPGSKTSLLDSDSKFLAVDNNQEIEAPSYDPPPAAPRQPSARERRRWKHLEDMARSDKPYGVGYKPPTPGGFSLNSVTSFNIDEVALKNEARLRKLEKLRGPGSTHDPDEVLKRFVTDHNRPESTISGGSLLDTDTIYHPL